MDDFGTETSDAKLRNYRHQMCNIGKTKLVKILKRCEKQKKVKKTWMESNYSLGMQVKKC